MSIQLTPDAPKIKYSRHSICKRDWFQDPPWISKSVDAQDPMHTVDPLHLPIPKHRLKMLFSIYGWLNSDIKPEFRHKIQNTVQSLKSAHISRPHAVKPVLFKSQMYMYIKCISILCKV